MGLLGLSFGLAPGTVLAYNPGDIYTEGPPPTTPPTEKKPEKKNPGKKKNPGNHEKPGKKNNAGNQGDGGNDSGAVGTVVPVDGSGNPPAGSDGAGNSTGTGGAPADTAQGGTPGAQDDNAAGTDDGTVAVTPASENKTDDGGSALPVIIAILVGVPLIGFGAYYFWAKRRDRDDEFHDLDSAYGSEQH